MKAQVKIIFNIKLCDKILPTLSPQLDLIHFFNYCGYKYFKCIVSKKKDPGVFEMQSGNSGIDKNSDT